MAGDPIALAAFVALGLLLTFGPIIAGIVLLTRGGTRRRKAQIDYLGWLAQNGYSVPEHPGGMPRSMYPPQVLSAGQGLRTWGGILVGLGLFIFIVRVGSVTGGS